jgi:tetratricopeptide (TPR) repeat protein
MKDIVANPSLSLGAQCAAKAQYLFKFGDLTGAKEQADASLAAGYESADLHNLRGILFSRAGLELDAVSAYERALVISPRMVTAQCNLAISLKQLGRLDAAIACWHMAIDVDPTFTDPYIALALVRIDRREFDAAEGLLKRALAIDGRCVPAHTNLGLVFQLRNELDAAIECCQRALEIDPSCIEAYVNLGAVFHRQRKALLARDCFGRALALEPNSIVAKYNLGQTLLLLGDFARGWPYYEARFAWWQKNGAVLPTFKRHRWNGQEAAGVTLLLVAEQGFGDTLQFVRYASILAAKGATILVECQADLVELLRSVPGVSQIYARGDPLPEYDLFCPLMSLPMLLNTSLQTIPNQVPYVRPNPLLAAEWKERIGQTKSMKVGFAWSGSSRSFDYQLSQVNRRRSLPLETCRSLLTVPGVEFFSVQKDSLSWDELTILGSTSIREFPNALRDFSDTAALISNLDLIISVDTSVAHLAGAMGKPVWMVSRYDGCWRWLLDRHDSPWYPTMRIFRQPRPEDWGSVVDSIAAELARISVVQR